MKLLIVSGMPHYRKAHGVVGWGPTVQEIDHLGQLCQEVHHVAPLHDGQAPAMFLPYASSKIVLLPVRPAGGRGLRAKLGILWAFPAYLRKVLRELRWADAVHVRCPDNISLLTILVLSCLRSPRLRWVKYAGNWSPEGRREPWSYALQRWWLRCGLHRGVVTVNGCWPNQPAHVYTFLNPCLAQNELEQGARTAQAKELSQPLNLVFVGRIETAKGAEICLQTIAQLNHLGVQAKLDFIGEGPQRGQLEHLAGRLQLGAQVEFRGSLPRDDVSRFYANAHFVLLPSETEGWPKVLSEAMAYGTVPIASAVGSIPGYLGQFGTGRAIGSRDAQSFTAAILAYLKEPQRWKEHSQNAVQAAKHFTYGEYLGSVQKILNLPTQMQGAAT